MEKRIYSKLKYYLKEIKANAKVLYDEETFDKINNNPKHKDYRLISLSFLVLPLIQIITPLTIFSFAFNFSFHCLYIEGVMYACCFYWALVLWYILAILFRNL